MKKIILLIQIITFLMIICCGIFIYYNGNIEVSLLTPKISIPLWCLKSGSFIAGILLGTALCGIYITKQNEKFSALERRNEKKEIKADDSEAKIKVLENKINTLEIALNKALKKQ